MIKLVCKPYARAQQNIVGSSLASSQYTNKINFDIILHSAGETEILPFDAVVSCKTRTLCKYTSSTSNVKCSAVGDSIRYDISTI